MNSKKMNFEIINQEAMERDIADYVKDGRLTEPSDGKRYEWRKMIDAVK